MTQTPYYGGDHHPPPMFVAELDSQPGRPGDAPSHHGPDGVPIFEMAGEPVLTQQPQTQSPVENHSSLPNEWPAPLKSPGMSNVMSQGDAKDEPSKDTSTTSQPVMANPWAYFGPESPEDKFKEPQAEGRRPSKPVYKPYPGNNETYPPKVPQSTRPPVDVSTPNLTSDDNTFYPAPLKLAHRPAKPASPLVFKPYAPPESQDTSDLLPKPLNRPDRTNTQSPTTPSSYQPYRPHSPQPPVHAAPASDPRPATASPLQSAPLASPPGITQQQPVDSAPHHFHSAASPIQPANLPATEPNLPSRPANSLPTSPKPQPEPQPQKQHGIPNAAPAKPVPSSASPHFPSPMTPSFQQSLVVAPSPATPAQSTGVPFSQPQYAAHVAVPSYSQAPTLGGGSSSPAVSNNPGLPFAQPQYAAPVQAHDYGSCQSSVTPSTNASPGVSSPAYNSSQLSPAQSSSYAIPQPMYSPAPTSSTPGGTNISLQHSPAVYQQAAHTAPATQQSHIQQPTAESYGNLKPTQIPQSPPPPYVPQDTGPGVGANSTASSNHTMYQPSPVGTYSPQHQYPTQPSYAPTTSPPLQGLQPPALPPRPSSSQGFAPSSGFGSGPTGYNPSNYPPPPQTHFSPPPPALPARPGLGKLAGGGGKIFGSSSADKWLRKTGQVLESTLAPYLQGQSGSYRPGSHGPQGQQGQPIHQAPGPYQHQAQYFHAPHLAPQFRGAPESGPPQHGPGSPGY
ncbi:hypothetical protein FSPOR_5505 [Fusarium sporotrichioides]|uniref:Uncharacterized protein n=1 Tax=Fusarium sporotrichioides TaxID=5514 RepID=A0A395S6I2_FUSSP|nr:hypothetical protein FSPOR_5505 [Fusarium sporotrichioides]